MAKKITNIVFNRYLWVTIFMLVWMFAFDSFDIMSQVKLSKKIEALEADKVFYQTEIARLKETSTRWNSDAKETERYAREKYLMKRDNEDLYIIVDEESVAAESR